MQELVDAIAASKVVVSSHAADSLRERSIDIDKLCTSVTWGEILEDYPDDYPCPSCLLLSSADGQALHSVWAYNQSSQVAILITVYHPDPEEWVNHRIRK